MCASLLLIWFLVLAFYYYLKRLEIVRKSSTIPSPPSYPFIGHAAMFIGKPESKVFMVMDSIRKKFDRIVAIWLGPYLSVFVFDADDVQSILKESKHMNKAYQYEFLRPWLGDSILLSNGEKFRQNKKILMQSFHANNLKSYVDVFNRHSKVLVGELDKELMKEEFDVNPYLSLCTMNALLETTLGVDKNTILGPNDVLNYSKAVEKVTRFVHKRAYKVWLYPEITFKFSKLKKNQDQCIAVLNEITNRVIAKRRKEYEERNLAGNEGKCSVFVDNFFEAVKEDGQKFMEDEIKDEVMTIMFAGQDTTTVSIGFALSLLGVHKFAQEKVIRELYEIFGDSERVATYEDLQQMKYLEQVIMETWRLFPPIPLIAKTTTRDLVLEGNHIIPKNTTIAIIIMILHRNPKYFPNPDKFNPDHFLPEKIKDRHPYSFIPFSANYRTCIGNRYAMLVIKVVLSMVFRKYVVTSRWREKDFKLAAQTTLKRREGFLIGLQKRAKY